MPVPDQKYFAVAVMHKMLQKLAYLIAIDAALHNLKVQIATWGNFV